jgi:hypothetical protein
MQCVNYKPFRQGFLDMSWQLGSTRIWIHKWGICLHQESVQGNESIFKYFTYSIVRFIFTKITCTCTSKITGVL